MTESERNQQYQDLRSTDKAAAKIERQQWILSDVARRPLYEERWTNEDEEWNSGWN